ncbi:Sensor histidine kinase RcsC [Streptomyces californicus]
MHEAGVITMRVLVAEDEETLAELVATGLRRAGFAVDTVYSGDAALAYLGLHDYDVVVLDRDLPRVHGDDVARRLIASGSRTRILMLTASGAMEDRVAGLDLGADDYVTKPFEFPELVSRVRALRRRSVRPVPPQLERHGIRLDTDGAPRCATAGSWTSRPRSSPCSNCSWRRTAARSARRNCWSGPGTPTRTRSPARSASA